MPGPGHPATLRPWQKGQSGNPGGKPALPPELRAIKALTHTEAARIIAKYARMECGELAKLTGPECAAKLPAIDAAIIRIFQKAIESGDFMRLSFLLERALGKPPIVASEGDPDSALANMTDDELVKHVEEIIAKRKGTAA